MAWHTTKKPIPETTAGMHRIERMHMPSGPFSLWQRDNEYFVADKSGKIVFGPELACDYASMKMNELNTK